MKVKKRKAQAEVIGAIFFIILATIVFTIFASLTAAQYAMARASAQAQLIVGRKATENLVVTLDRTTRTVTIKNNGPATVSISYYIGLNGGGQPPTIGVPSPQPFTIAPRGNKTLSGISPSIQQIGIVTSYGNIWWNS